jgi:hypothetical protein
MDSEGGEHKSLVATAPDRRGGERRAPVVDAEFKVIHPWRLWRALRRSWWAIGPYLAYCTALWGLAALVAWLMDQGRRG